VARIEHAEDPRVAAYREVRDGELVRAHGLFVAEGRHVVRRVLADRRYHVQSVLVNDAALRDLAPDIEQLDSDLPVFLGEAAALAAIAGYGVHRGCLALVRRPPETSVDDLLARSSTLVILDGVSNADNVGGVFRNAAAFMADGVLLSASSCDPLYRKAIRTSMAATLRVPFARARADEWSGIIDRVRGAGFTTVALTPRQPSETLERFAAMPRPPQLALIVGNEGDGLTEAMERAADHRVRIPISDSIDSLNLAVATGIALHALRQTTM
jgi:tRNA G18 (ribose-2'-O)-methylase SpoU